MERKLRLTVAAVAGLALANIASAATYRFDNGGGTNTWENPQNWNTVLPGPDGLPGTPDDENADGLPGAADDASLNPNTSTGSPLVVSISSAQSVLNLEVSNPGGAGSNVSGTTTLNVLPGTLLTVGGGGTGGNGLRIGRTLNPGQTPPSQQGSVIQTGGTVLGRIRLSPEQNSADSLYRISGGSMIAAPSTTAAAVQDLSVGATTSAFDRAEFHVVGSGITEMRFRDVQVADSTTGSGGRAVIHFSLDAGGITPIIAEDEFQFRASGSTTLLSGLLVVDLIGEAPQADVTLVQADRLGNNGGAQERFSNFADGDTLVASGAGFDYTYTVDYTDGQDDGVLSDVIVLRYVSRAVVPEPASLAMIGLGGLALALASRLSRDPTEASDDRGGGRSKERPPPFHLAGSPVSVAASVCVAYV